MTTPHQEIPSDKTTVANEILLPDGWSCQCGPVIWILDSRSGIDQIAGLIVGHSGRHSVVVAQIEQVGHRLQTGPNTIYDWKVFDRVLLLLVEEGKGLQSCLSE